MATKVTLRQKAISKNRHSLYLDFYPAIIHSETGEPTRREFLGMYLQDPIKVLKHKTKNGTIKETPVYDNDTIINAIREKSNTDILSIAESIRDKRQNILNKPEIYTVAEKEHLKIQARKKEKDSTSFVKYFKKLADKRKASNHDNWISAYHYLLKFANENFTDGNLTFEDLTEDVCEDFKEYLSTRPSNRSNKTKLAVNSTVSYFNKIKAALKQAYKDGYLQSDLNAKVEPIKEEENHRNFLTKEEIRMLIDKDCSLPELKQAALLSIYSGLRFGDIEKLVWNEIEYIKGDGYYIRFTTQKTGRPETMPISDNAFALFGKRGEALQRVFPNLKYSAWTNNHLFKWLVSAGITKQISFHCFRHTFAIEQLRLETDVYTLQKMMGHSQIKTTEIYAKVQPKAKREAANKQQY